MNRISLSDLPRPPKDKSGWPWTQQVGLGDTGAGKAADWPSVSIVTPSYNQGCFLEETIRSVLLQGYPNLEYFVIDGGSRDESLEIIKKYAPWLTGWVSETDNGQTSAINKGLARSTGTVWAWLNSDDIYMPGAIFKGSKALKEDPKMVLVYGDASWITEKSESFHLFSSGPLDARSLLTGTGGYGIPQAAAFMRRDVVVQAGRLNEKLHMAIDYDLWIKLAFSGGLSYLPGVPMAGIRSHVNTKTRNRQLEAYLEDIQVIKDNLKHPQCPSGITLFGNAEYISANLGVARYYLSKNMWLKAVPYMFKAAHADFFHVMNRFYKYAIRKL